MFEDIAIWTIVLAVLAGLGVAFAVPSTRPYAKKYWWAALIVVVPLIGYVLLKRRPGNRIDDAIDEGRDIAGQNSSVIDAIVDKAHEEMSWADAELARKRLQSQAAVDRMDTELETVKKIDNSLERRKALIKVVESYS